MEKILPAPSPKVGIMCLLNGMQLAVELAPEPNYLDPEIFAKLAPHDPVLARRPFIIKYDNAGSGQLSVGFMPLILLPYNGESQALPFLRSQILYLIEPKEAAFSRQYLRESSGILPIQSAVGPAGSSLRL